MSNAHVSSDLKPSTRTCGGRVWWELLLANRMCGVSICFALNCIKSCFDRPPQTPKSSDIFGCRLDANMPIEQIHPNLFMWLQIQFQSNPSLTIHWNTTYLAGFQLMSNLTHLLKVLICHGFLITSEQDVTFYICWLVLVHVSYLFIYFCIIPMSYPCDMGISPYHHI